MKYYILSMKHTGKTDAFITLWRHNEVGYTLYVESAGRYTEEHAKEIIEYNSALNACMVSENLIQSLKEKDHSNGAHGILNTKHNWALFGVII